MRSPYPAPCPTCGGPVNAKAVSCDNCGETIRPDRVRRSRAGFIAAGSAVSLLWMWLSLLAGAVIAVVLGLGISAIWLTWAGLLSLSMGVASWMTTLAFLDLKWMSGGRVDPSGRARTVIAGSVSAVSVLAHWAAIGFCLLKFAE